MNERVEGGAGDHGAGSARARSGSGARERRLGPIVWVSGLRTTGPGDRWAHRRGEPRPLALFWSVYLLGSAVLTLLAVRTLTVPTSSQLLYAGRGMLVLMALGLCLLWPMLWLSQEFPARASRSVLGDLMVLLVPAQVVVWPMVLVTRWPWEVAGGLSVMLVSWSMLAGSVLVAAMARGPGAWRGAWMLGVIAGLSAAPGCAAVWPTPMSAGLEVALRMASPVTAVFQMTASASGHSPRIEALEWRMALAPLILGAALWAWAVMGRRVAGGRGGSAGPGGAGVAGSPGALGDASEVN